MDGLSFRALTVESLIRFINWGLHICQSPQLALGVGASWLLDFDVTHPVSG